MNMHSKFTRWMKGNEDAVEFIEKMIRISSLWDDLIDRDRQPSNDEINSGMWEAMVGIHANEFFAHHKDMLLPVFLSAINNWKIANAMESGDDQNDLMIAFIIRSSYVDVIAMAAMIIGGTEWAEIVGMEARLLAHEERFDGYLKALADEKQARKGV